MTRVCHLTSVHPRYDVRIFNKECKSLLEAGYKVYLIVADGKGGEVKGGITILDVGKTKGRIRRMTISTYKIYQKAKKINATIYHFHDPELIPAGLMLRIKGFHVIYDIHEDYSEQILRKKYLAYIFRILIAGIYRLFEIVLLRRFSGLIVPQPLMIKRYQKTNSQTELICNFVKVLRPLPTRRLQSCEYIYHAGGLSEDRGLLNMVSVMGYLNGDIKLVLAGKMNADITNKVKRLHGWEKVEYLGNLDFEQSLSFYQDACIGLILYNNVGQYHLSHSIKLFEYMNYGIPVIMPDFGEWVKFNKENKCGINVNVQNYKVVAKVVESLIKDSSLRITLGNNGRNAILKKYNWDNEACKLKKFYDTMTAI